MKQRSRKALQSPTQSFAIAFAKLCICPRKALHRVKALSFRNTSYVFPLSQSMTRKRERAVWPLKVVMPVWCIGVLSHVFLSVAYVYTLRGWYCWQLPATEVVDVVGRGVAGGCDILNACHVGRVPCDAVVATTKKGVFKVVEVGVDGTAVVSVECFGIVRTYCAIIVSSGAKVLCSSSFYISQTTVKYRIQSGWTLPPYTDEALIGLGLNTCRSTFFS